MAGFIKKILKMSIVAFVVPGLAYAVQAPNLRTATGAKNVVRNQDAENSAAIRRSATSVIARSASKNTRQQNRTVVSARPAAVQTVKSRSVRSAVNNVNKARSASKSTLAHSGSGTTTQGVKNTSRAGNARATAIFNDVSVIGGGYSTCRDAYATCMDQFCANANDTYRRCFCSDRFTSFRETEDKLDSALQMLADFQDTNLNAVDKTAAEVNAMYTATAGEDAIKKDTSASQKLLDNIDSILSGRSYTSTQSQSNSLGILDFSGFGDTDDIWGGSSSIFGGNSGADLSTAEGKQLYNSASEQCAQILSESCGTDAMFNLARSAYSIMITQDCNAYEKNLNAKRASLEETIRTAEKYLREARLEEYRAHNSADVNECLAKVESAMQQSTACGENYGACLDYTGLYINSSTGEPIYSKALFGLQNLIKFDGTADVVGANPNFDAILENKKMFATTALDSCRDLADTVWNEFKRAAIIKIAQAQDEKIQEIKDSCVTTIKQCYDNTTGALKDMDTTKSQSTGAIAAATARGACYDKVLACAALYGDTNGCVYNASTGKLENNGNNVCGLQSLLTFVDTVDSVKIAEGCESVLTKYAHELCDPKVGDTDDDIVYPMGCATMPRSQLQAAMQLRVDTFCARDLVDTDASNTLTGGNAYNTDIMNQIIADVYNELEVGFSLGCTDEGGMWVSPDGSSVPLISSLQQDFYKKYYGTTINNDTQVSNYNLAVTGWCVVGSDQQQCEALGNTYATYEGGQCKLTSAWYSHACRDWLGGTWNDNNGTCSVSTAETYHVDLTNVTSVDNNIVGTVITLNN